MIDIYFDRNYGKLYEKMENGHCEVFEYRSHLGNIRHMFIKREIPYSFNNETYYDLVTPYGYGGPIITEFKNGCKGELVEGFKKEFQRYCIENNIVSEFVRFHPIFNNAIDFKDCYEIEHIRNTVGTNLKDFDDPIMSEFSKSCRKNIKKALKANISYEIIEKPKDVDDFKRIYYSTMQRNNADDFYYFDDVYFKNCVDLFGDNLLLVKAIFEDETIAMGLYFTYDKIIHIHLSGTLSDYLYLSPAYILRYAVTLWGKENGYELIHHGGGRTNDPNDGLYLFKKQFGKNTDFKFFIGKKIWNYDIYAKLCDLQQVPDEIEFFPAYRYRLEKR